jgi:predicted alpha/beta hydrolase family esterase
MLCRNLEEAFGTSLILRSFRWSGSNSFSCRSAAATGLSAYLQRGIEDNPFSKQVVIAHSHGGNVVLYALRDPKIRERIDGVVCISTPFIVALPRHFGAMPHVQAMSVRFAFFLFLAAAICMRLPYFQNLNFDNVRIAHWLVFIVVYITTVFLVSPFETVIGSFMRKQKAKVVHDLAICPVDDLRLLVVRSTADEASSALTAAQFVGWLATSCWTALSTMFGLLDLIETPAVNWSKRRKTFLWASIVIFFVGYWRVIYETRLNPGEKHNLLWLLFLTACFGVAVATVLPFITRWVVQTVVLIPNILIGLLFAPLYVILSIFSLPFSPVLAFALWSLQITVEPTPAGACRVVQISPSKSSGLRHSSPYSDPSAVQEIVNWIFASAIGVERDPQQNIVAP